MVFLTHEPLDAQAVTAQVLKPTNGGVVTFLGVTRNHNEGRRVLHLEYEAYPEMALRKLEDIRQEIRQKWGIEDVAVAHRLGRLEIGETSLVVAVGAPHRKEAYEACAYVVDRIKDMVPIWKKEFFEGGEVWIGHSSHGQSSSTTTAHAGEQSPSQASPEGSRRRNGPKGALRTRS
jgi:molybdopterin synthase catalytic subunit